MNNLVSLLATYDATALQELVNLTEFAVGDLMALDDATVTQMAFIWQPCGDARTPSHYEFHIDNNNDVRSELLFFFAQPSNADGPCRQGVYTTIVNPLTKLTFTSVTEFKVAFFVNCSTTSEFPDGLNKSAIALHCENVVKRLDAGYVDVRKVSNS